MYLLYTKPYKNPTDLIIKLKSQNLIIENEIDANKILSKVSYFRFKIYLRPFLNITTTKFHPNSTFENAYELYLFDEELNSWLKLIRDVRNRVAHHSRVWNCNYREPQGIRQTLSQNLQPSQSNKIYLFFVILYTLYQKQIAEKDIKHPTTQRFINSMGIPKGWLV